MERLFKDFGKRVTLGKKNQKRNLMMFRIVQKQFNIQDMVHNIYKD
jgi:hypothetical protein